MECNGITTTKGNVWGPAKLVVFFRNFHLLATLGYCTVAHPVGVVVPVGVVGCGISPFSARLRSTTYQSFVNTSSRKSLHVPFPTDPPPPTPHPPPTAGDPLWSLEIPRALFWVAGRDIYFCFSFGSLLLGGLQRQPSNNSTSSINSIYCKIKKYRLRETKIDFFLNFTICHMTNVPFDRPGLSAKLYCLSWSKHICLRQSEFLPHSDINLGDPPKGV